MLNKKVLVVDDSALIRKQLGTLFDKAGYDVGFAKNGQEGLDLYKEKKPAIVITACL